MRRMEVRCCCTPNKLLGTLPVHDAVFRGEHKTISFPLMGDPLKGLRPSRIAFDVAEWCNRIQVSEELMALATPASLKYLADAQQGGVALRHENVTIATLRRIPGFIEVNHG